MRAALCCLLLVGCYNPDLVTTRFVCAETSACPEGQTCIAGRCETGTPDLTLLPLPDDMAVPVDQATPDLRPPDQATPDLRPPPDLVPPICPGGGVQILPDGSVWGCRGAIRPGMAASLCSSGYHVCGMNDGNALKSVSTAALCGTENGFYVADVLTSLKLNDPMKGRVRCEAADNVEWAPALLGCGKGRDNTAAAATSCSNLNAYVQCKQGGSWVCTSSLADATYSGNSGGVLCCKN